MPLETLTHAELGDRLKVPPGSASTLVKRHRLPRSRSSDGKTLAQVDLTEITHSPVSRGPQAPGGRQAFTALKPRIETLEAELIEMEAIARGHRADFENECEGTNKLLAKLLKSSIEMKLGDKVRLTPKYAASLMKTRSGNTRGIVRRPQGGAFDWRTRRGEIAWINSKGDVGVKWLDRKTVDPYPAAALQLVKA